MCCNICGIAGVWHCALAAAAVGAPTPLPPRHWLTCHLLSVIDYVACMHPLGYNQQAALQWCPVGGTEASSTSAKARSNGCAGVSWYCSCTESHSGREHHWRGRITAQKSEAQQLASVGEKHTHLAQWEGTALE